MWHEVDTHKKTIFRLWGLGFRVEDSTLGRGAGLG